MEWYEIYDWYEDTINEQTAELEEIGLSDIEIRFTGFWCQGDGASFTATVEDYDKFLNYIMDQRDFERQPYGRVASKDQVLTELFDNMNDYPFKELYENGLLTIQIVRETSHYYHEKTVSVSLDLDEFDKEDIETSLSEDELKKEIYEFVEYLEKYLDEWLENKCIEIYRELEKEFNRLEELYGVSE